MTNAEALRLRDEQRRAHVKKKLREYRPLGCELVLSGAIILLIWALGDLITRWDAMDGLIKVLYGMVKDGVITAGEAIGRVRNEKEALRDLFTLLYLALAALLGLMCVLTHKAKTGYFSLAVGLAAFLYEPYTSFLARALNYTVLLQYLGCGLLIAGSALKTLLTLSKKRALRLQYERKHPLKADRRKPLSAVGNAKTLIPEHNSRIERRR